MADHLVRFRGGRRSVRGDIVSGAGKNLAVVIMAAGLGKRMKSDLPKVLVPLAGKPLLEYVLDTAKTLTPAEIVVIVGHGREKVIERFGAEKITFVTQAPLLGTGHAVAQTESELAGFDGSVLVLSGDAPLITEETLKSLIAHHTSGEATITMLTCDLEDPGSYGRIVRKDGDVIAIVEMKDATDEQKTIREINSGIYLFEKSFLFRALAMIDNDNAQNEYYLTDLVALAVQEGRKVSGIGTENPFEVMGANTMEDLQILLTAVQG